jgi:hypothetical protein
MRHHPYKTQQRVLDTSKEMTKETDTRKTSNKNEIPLQSQLDQGLHAHFLT